MSFIFYILHNSIRDCHIHFFYLKLRACLIYWMEITLEIVIFISINRRYCNEITITGHKFSCNIYKACKSWYIRKIYIFENILILKPIIYAKE